MEMKSEESISIDLSKILKRSHKPNLKFASEMLAVAKDDLHASKELYEKGRYAFSVYHLQQAVEKCAKAYGLLFGMVSRKELREISHKSPMVFLSLFKWTDNPEIGKPLSKIFKSKEKTLTLARSNDAQMPKLLGIIRQLRKNKLPEFYEVFIELYLLSVITYPHESYTRYPGEEIDYSEYKRDYPIVKNIKELWAYSSYCITHTENMINTTPKK